MQSLPTLALIYHYSIYKGCALKSGAVCLHYPAWLFYYCASSTYGYSKYCGTVI